MSERSEGQGGKGPHDEDQGEGEDSSGDFLRKVARVPSQAPPSVPSESLVGARVDHFLVRSKLGAGGMGVVYEAEDEKLRRIVALKVLPSNVDPEARHRFVREARAASRIVHPNVATIYEAGESEHGAYIAMEYVRGETLREWLRTPRTIAARSRVVREVASALAAAHTVGIVHRDLKPDNVIVTPAEGVKVLDFGLAKQSAGSSPSLDETATAEGRILGTPSYMSPEQAKGMPVDARSDVFSFGVVLYEVFTGVRPFKGDTAMGILIAIDRDEPVAPTRINAETPVAIERIIGRALEKKPADRYTDGAELFRSLQALEPSIAPLAPSPLPLHSPWFKAIVAVGVLVEIIALVVFLRTGAQHGRPLGPAVDAAAVHSAGKAITDFPPYGSKNEDALEAYRRGQHYVRSAMAGGANLFERAAAIDPGFAEAQLRTALYRVDGDDFALARPHFREAKVRRASLIPRDRALLDAFEPMIERSPADPHESAERMRGFLATFTDDAEMAYFAGVAAVHDVPASAPALYEHALALDPSFARALLRLTEEAIASDRIDDAEKAIERCLTIAPDSLLCESRRTFLLGQRGACAQEESEARRMLTVAPESMVARAYLGSALIGEGRSVAAVRELIDQGRRQASDGGTLDPFKVLIMESEADLLEGDFEASFQRFRAFEPVVAPLEDEDAHALLATNEVILLAEMGRDAEGHAVARDFLARHDAWEPNPNDVRGATSDYTVALASYLRRAGVMSKQEADAVRAAEIARWSKRAHTQEERELVWAMAYANGADTAEEAKEAFAALPAFGSLPTSATSAEANAFVGHTLLLAGRIDEALPMLERETLACDLLGQTWPHLRAYFDLGQAREAKRDTAGACAAYGALLARWGSAKPRSVTGEKALARSKALRCGK